VSFCVLKHDVMFKKVKKWDKNVFRLPEIGNGAF
jgi:hypothetical protein